MKRFQGMNLYRFLLVILVFLSVPSIVLADDIPITGSARVSGANSFTIGISGPSITLTSATPDAPVSISGCSIPTSLNFGLGALPGYSQGTVNGVSTNVLGGFLNVSPCYGPGSAPEQHATVFGQIIGYQVLTVDGHAPYSLGPAVFTIDIHGTGTLSLIGLSEGDTAAIYTFTGTADVVPEPATVLLFATGAALVTFVLIREERGQVSV